MYLIFKDQIERNLYQEYNHKTIVQCGYNKYKYFKCVLKEQTSY